MNEYPDPRSPEPQGHSPQLSVSKTSPVKIVVAGLAAVVTIGMVASCGGGGGRAAPADASTSVSASPSPILEGTYDEGRAEGDADGYAAVLRESTDGKTDAWIEGYDVGYAEGHARKETEEAEADAKAEAERKADAKARKAADFPSERELAKIVRDPDSYAGKYYKLWGEVTQYDSATGIDVLRADIAHRNTTSYGYFDGENAVLVGSAELFEDLINEDVFTATVKVVSSYSYDTQIGGSTTVPLFEAVSIERK